MDLYDLKTVGVQALNFHCAAVIDVAKELDRPPN